jgi:CBS domain-containing protein
MSVGRICTRSVDLADADEAVQFAASRMNTRNVGTLVVVDGDKVPIGILTDRDLALKVVGKGLDPNTTNVESVMSAVPRSVTESTPIETAIVEMRAGPYRRLPVVDEDGRLVGLVSLDDVLDLLSEEFQEIGKLLRSESPRAVAL